MNTKEKKTTEKNFLKIFWEEYTRTSTFYILLAVICGFVFGALLIVLTTDAVYAGFKQSLWEGLKACGSILGKTVEAIFVGSFGDPKKIITAFQSGDANAIRYAINPFFESLTVSTPYIFTGLALALGFRSGLLNIGAEGQVYIGGMASVIAGFAIKGLPAIVHVPLAILAGMLGGAMWGAFSGWLKAKTGAHEVITGIMMNYIAILLVDYLASGPLRNPAVFTPETPPISEFAKFYKFFPAPIRFHMGFFIAIAMVFLVRYFLFKTTWGFELRQVGLNPQGSRNAGMNTNMLIIAGMALSGALAGLAWVNEIQGVQYFMHSQNFTTGYGRNAISLALIGNSHPIGVLFAAIFYGFFTSASKFMTLRAGVPHHIVPVMTALIMFFIATPALVRTIFRIKEIDKSQSTILEVQI